MAEANIKVTVDATELDAKLSKSMKELGVYYDQYGRLLNKEGEFVAGLSQARIKMGEYVDSMGRMRNANGDLIDGLTTVQKNLRMYIDELGNIRTIEGDFVAFSQERLAQIDAETKAKLVEVQRESEMKARLRSDDEAYTKTVRENCRKRMEEIVEESNRMRSEAEKQAAVEKAAAEERQRIQNIGSGISTAAGNVAALANQLSTVVALVGKGDKDFNQMARTITIAGQSVSQFVGTANTVVNLVKIYKDLRAAMAGATAAQVLLNAVSGNWVALAVGGIAAGATAMGMYASMSKDAANGTDGMVDSTDRLGRAWEVVIDKITNAKMTYEEALKAGTEELNKSPSQTLEEELDSFKKKREEFEKWKEVVSVEMYSITPSGQMVVYNRANEEDIAAKSKELGVADKEFEYNLRGKNLAEDFLPTKESEKLQEKLKEFNLLYDAKLITLRDGVTYEEVIQAANKKIAEAQQREAEAKQKEAEEGLSKWFKKSDTTDLIDFEAEKAKILATEKKSEAEKDAAVRRLTKAYNDQSDRINMEFAEEVGFSAFLKDSPKTLEDMEKTWTGWIDRAKAESEYWGSDKGKARLEDAIENARKDFLEEQERARNSFAANTGFARFEPKVDNDPTEDVAKMNETIERWRIAAETSEDAFWRTVEGQERMNAAIEGFKEACQKLRDDAEKYRKERLETLLDVWGLNDTYLVDEDLRKQYNANLELFNADLKLFKLSDPDYVNIGLEREYQNKLKELNKLIEEDVKAKGEGSTLKKREKEIKDALLKKLRDDLIKKKEEADRDAARERDQRLSELGITRLREQSKTALERYIEEQNNLTTALREGLIGQNEFGRLQAVIDKEYQEMTRQKENRRMEKIAAYTPPPSLTAGSQELYSAMTRNNTDVWRADLLSNIRGLHETLGQGDRRLQALQEKVTLMLRKMGVL